MGKLSEKVQILFWTSDAAKLAAGGTMLVLPTDGVAPPGLFAGADADVMVRLGSETHDPECGTTRAFFERAIQAGVREVVFLCSASGTQARRALAQHRTFQHCRALARDPVLGPLIRHHRVVLEALAPDEEEDSDDRILADANLEPTSQPSAATAAVR